ncbi:MAG: hypothetical protein WDO19_16585 [Bacteroidota bacterium]
MPVSFVFAMKESSLHYHFFASDIKEYHHAEKEVALQEMLRDFFKRNGKQSKKYPEQWYNYYNFWQ